jgi:hypothetical protein
MPPNARQTAVIGKLNDYPGCCYQGPLETTQVAKRQTLSPPRQKDVGQAVVLPVNLIGKTLITLYLESISAGN